MSFVPEALEPTAVAPVCHRFGMRVGGNHHRPARRGVKPSRGIYVVADGFRE